ncbi:DUF1045 domain-containing protein [Roseovarius pelagicus]|uniref:DUF1045 domain-containing protein n=1 Tax=Roseovarius pelagicus TaxID=2980108 RepID=A0ABY6DEH2_9RHOB|nr:DUF1045 domain-containing protein [Roseovarius pelagicus]UXX84475.1 DUF1045 domain-containing protein [Roseovarius pelagicus]
MFRRYAIYYTPPDGALADFGAAWLGWDIARGVSVPHLVMDGLPAPVWDITERPRRYGLHATIKPPFTLAKARHVEELQAAFDAFCATRAPVTLPALTLAPLGRFLALIPSTPCAAVTDLAAHAVRHLDDFRAPPDRETLDRYRTGLLTAAQEQNLQNWGYPHVMDAFRFHITLSGKLPKRQVAVLTAALAAHVEPLLPAPFVLDALSLVGEDEDGRFHLIRRVALSR